MGLVEAEAVAEGVGMDLVEVFGACVLLDQRDAVLGGVLVRIWEREGRGDLNGCQGCYNKV